jgi:hypothetical protein
MTDQKLVEKLSDIFTKFVSKIDKIRVPDLIEKSNTIIFGVSCITLFSIASTAINYRKYLLIENIQKRAAEREDQLNTLIINQQIFNTELRTKMYIFINNNRELVDQNSKMLYLFEANNALLKLLLDENRVNNGSGKD